MFEVDLKDFKLLVRQYKINAREFRAAQINVLNSQAFGTRASAINVIQRGMTVRNKRFVASSLQVTKASAGAPYATVGSVYRKDFSGWVEQQTGKRASRKRLPTRSARRGNWRNRVAPSLRMKTQNKFVSDKNIIRSTGNASERTYGMLSYVRRTKYRKPFILSGSKKYRKGLYKLVGKKVKLIQQIGGVQGNVRRFPWMTYAVQRYMRKNAPIKVWAESVKRIVNFRMRG